MEKEFSSEEADSDTTLFILYEFPQKAETTNGPNSKGKINRLRSWSRGFVYIWAAAFLIKQILIFIDWHRIMAIIGGALLQLKSEFCLGILQNEVSSLRKLMKK